MWRRHLLAAVLVLLQIPVLAVLAVGWLVTGGVLKCFVPLVRYLARSRTTGRTLRPRLGPAMKTIGLVGAVLAVLAIGALWVLSHFEPHTFGTCHPVALQIGKHATTHQCEAYNPADFAVPLALVVLLIFIVSDGDMKLGGLGWTIEKKAREAREQVSTLQEDELDIERRATEFRQTVNPNRE
jgi:hypothetical protein